MSYKTILVHSQRNASGRCDTHIMLESMTVPVLMSHQLLNFS
jgi:hypothetical protein